MEQQQHHRINLLGVKGHTSGLGVGDTDRSQFIPSTESNINSMEMSFGTEDELPMIFNPASR